MKENPHNVLEEIAEGEDTPEAVRACILRYIPDVPYEEQEKAFNVTKEPKPKGRDSKYEVSNEIIRDTLTFLNRPVPVKALKRDLLLNRLICGIQALLPDECHLCNAEYRVKRDEMPLLSCSDCGQGAHDACISELLATKLLNLNPTATHIFGIPGLHYLCPHCESNLIPDLGTFTRPETSQPDASESVVDNHATSSTDTVIPILTENPTDPESQTGELNELNLSPEHDRENREADSVFLEPNPRNDPMSVICPFYERGVCRYGPGGKGCRRSHPKPCPSFMKYGNLSADNMKGCYGEPVCTRYHPRICRSSMRNRTCFNEMCRFRHLRDTRRRENPSHTSTRQHPRIQPLMDLNPHPQFYLSTPSQPQTYCDGPQTPTPTDANKSVSRSAQIEECLLTIKEDTDLCISDLKKGFLESLSQQKSEMLAMIRNLTALIENSTASARPQAQPPICTTFQQSDPSQTPIVSDTHLPQLLQRPQLDAFPPCAEQLTSSIQFQDHPSPPLLHQHYQQPVQRLQQQPQQPVQRLHQQPQHRPMTHMSPSQHIAWPQAQLQAAIPAPPHAQNYHPQIPSHYNLQACLN